MADPERKYVPCIRRVRGCAGVRRCAGAFVPPLPPRTAHTPSEDRAARAPGRRTRTASPELWSVSVEYGTWGHTCTACTCHMHMRQSGVSLGRGQTGRAQAAGAACTACRPTSQHATTCGGCPEKKRHFYESRKHSLFTTLVKKRPRPPATGTATLDRARCAAAFLEGTLERTYTVVVQLKRWVGAMHEPVGARHQCVARRSPPSHSTRAERAPH